MPWGMFGMALLVVSVEVLISRHDPLTSLAAAEHRFAARVSRAAARFPVLCFGDSQMKDGLVPQVVETRLGKKTLNLAIAGSPAPSAYFLLRRVLESGARPAALLVDYHAWLLAVPPRQRVAMYAELCNLRECFELAWTMKDAGFFGSVAAARLLPSLRVRAELRTDVAAALLDRPGDRSREIVPHSRRNWAANGGAQVMPRNPEVAQVADFWDEAASYPERWKCVPVNAAYVKKFLKLAATRQIPVFFLVPPRHPRVQARREQLGLDALYTGFVRAATASYPNVTVLDARRSNYDPGVFIDSSHLDRQGASDFSNDVAIAVAGRLALHGEDHPRWVDLPRHQTRPEPVAMEDLAESELALKTAPEVLRR